MTVKLFKSFVILLILVGQVSACRMLGVIALPGHALNTRDAHGELHLFLASELEEFRLQGGSGSWPYSNRDGWAMTSYAPGVVQNQELTVRSEIEAYADDAYFDQTNSLLQRDEVNILMGHLRQTSSGAVDIQNPHPFIYDHISGDQYSFAHNGDLSKDLLRELIGDTWLTNHPPQTFGGGPWNDTGWPEVIDSELFFFWIMKNIEDANSSVSGIRSALEILEIRSPNHIKNFLFSDGLDLYAYRSSPNDDVYYFDGDPNDPPWYLEIGNQRAVMSTPPSTGPLSEIPWIELQNKHLLILKADGSTDLTPILSAVSVSNGTNIPHQMKMTQTFPNPFNASITLSGHVERAGLLNLSIYDVQGRLVYTIDQEVWQPGSYQFFWSGQNQVGLDLPSGSYFFRLSGVNYASRGKLLLLK